MKSALWALTELRQNSFTSAMNKRQYYRLRYPTYAALTLSTPLGDLSVVEISERGLRIVVEENCPVRLGDQICGAMQLHNGDRLSIEGRAGRLDEDEMVILDIEGITFASMIEEQQFMVQNYPSFGVQEEKAEEPNS